MGAHPPVPRPRHPDAARNGAARHVPGRRPAGQGRPRAPVHPLRRRVGDRHLPAARPAQRRRGPGRPGRGDPRGGRAAVRGPRLRRRAGRRRLPGRARAATAASSARTGSCSTTPPAGSSPPPRRRWSSACARRPASPSACTARDRAAPRWPWRWRRRGPVPTRSRRPPTRSPSAPTGPSAELFSQALAGVGGEPGLDLERAWEIASTIDHHLGNGDPVARVSPHVSLLAALNRVNSGLIANLERRVERTSTPPTGWPRCWRSSTSSAPRSARRRRPRRSARCIVRQAVDHVLSGRRWTSMTEEMRQLVLGEWGQTPGADLRRRDRCREARRPRRAARSRCPAWTSRGPRPTASPSSEEELCLVALFGDDARAADRARPRP